MKKVEFLKMVLGLRLIVRWNLQMYYFDLKLYLNINFLPIALSAVAKYPL